jgi:probable rRNA maturation factor
MLNPVSVKILILKTKKMIIIDVLPEFTEFIDIDSINKAGQTTLDLDPSRSKVDLSVAILDNAGIKELNLQFRGINQPTDVLSFPDEEIDPDTKNLYIGDVIISYPYALEQSKKAGHPLKNELQLLTIHGVLHLLGYDHSNKKEKKLMWEKQEEILQLMNCLILKMPEE